MSLDEQSGGGNVGRRAYKWKGARERTREYEDAAILRDAQHLRIREDLGEELSDSDRHVLTMAKRIERRMQFEQYRKRKEKEKEK